MAGSNRKLDHFTAAVLSEAATENEAILRDIEKKRRSALSAAEEAALNEAYEYVHSEMARIRAEKGREISRRVLENKRALALRREEIARQVFAQVRQMLEDYTASADYGPCLLSLFREAVDAVGDTGGLILHLRPQDMPHADSLKAAVPGRSLELRPGAFKLGGLILDCPARNLRADQTFDSKMEDLGGHFAELFGLSLADGSSPKECDEHA